MLFCVLASLAGCLLLPSMFNSWLIRPLVFVCGGVSFGIYTTSLIQLGERFAGQALIAGNAGFALVWASAASWARPPQDWRCNWLYIWAAIAPWPAVRWAAARPRSTVLAVFLMVEKRRV